MGLFSLFGKKKSVDKNNDIIDEWINEGKRLIYPEKYGDWENFVYRASEGKYFGLEVSGILVIMKELETGKDILEVLEVISSDPVAKDYMRSEIRNRVFEFSKRGPEFLETVLGEDNINESLRQKIEEVKKKNSQLDEKYSNKS